MTDKEKALRAAITNTLKGYFPYNEAGLEDAVNKIMLEVNIRTIMK